MQGRVTRTVMLGSAKALAVEDWCRGEATRVMAVVIIIDKVVLLFVVAVRVITVTVSRHPAERVQLVVQQAQDDHQTGGSPRPRQAHGNQPEHSRS